MNKEVILENVIKDLKLPIQIKVDLSSIPEYKDESTYIQLLKIIENICEKKYYV